MKIIYDLASKTGNSKDASEKLFLFLNVLFFVLAGAALWILCGRLIWPGFIALICFMGYPGIFAGFIGGVLFLYREDV